MTQQFDKKIALVTGGSSGIGRATARVLAREGALVVVVDIDSTGAGETMEQVKQLGGDGVFIRADISQASEVKSTLDEVVRRYGSLDMACNNSGIEGDTVRTAEVEESDFDRIMAVNVKGTWLCMKHEIAQMVQQGGGVIVNMASVAGMVGSHSMPVYGASKHAVVGLTRSAALEYALHGVRINAVCPSVIDTPFIDRAFAGFPKFVDAAKLGNPMRRLGTANEVAKVVAWLFSDAASFVNGAALPVDGGFTAQ